VPTAQKIESNVAFGGEERPPRCFAWGRAGARPVEKDTPMSKDATLYRMVLPDHVCPFGVRAKEMLEQAGYAVDDRALRSREEVDAFEEEQGVATTPQVFIGGERIGGSDDLERHLAG
jgi:glutaredoxin